MSDESLPQEPLPQVAKRPWWKWPSYALAMGMVGFIRLYQRFISPLTGPSCRYHPSCSAYAVKALQVHGPFKGFALGGWRIVRCNPFTKGGFDPVPPRGRWLPNVYPDGKPRPRHTVEPAGDTEVGGGPGIGHNGSVDTTSTSTDVGVPASTTATSSDPAPSIEQVTAPDLGTDGPAPSGPGQENA
jgi:putative membrane protein insertion efficiency factor